MKPIAPLMIEHRLIERMVSLLGRQLEAMGRTGRADSTFIAQATDFFRSYADRTHHGKEEDILLAQLARKKLSAGHRRMMKELLDEHVQARKHVAGLAEAGESYGRGDRKALQKIKDTLKVLAALYPEHIRKEDREFFIPVLAYFSEAEQQAMLESFREFDRNMIHERYGKMVETLEGRRQR